MSGDRGPGRSGRVGAMGRALRPVVLAGAVVAAGGTSATSLAAVAATAQPDLGLRRPADPPPVRHAPAALHARLDLARASLERARRVARGSEREAVDAALALRRVLADLAPTELAPGDADAASALVMAAQVVAESAAWDAVLRRGLDEPTVAGAIRRFTAVLEGGAADEARSRLAAAARILLEATAVGGEAGPTGGPDAAGAAGVGRGAAAAEAAARLDAAVRAADWLGDRDDLLAAQRAGDAGPGATAVIREAASVIERLNRLEPTARRRVRARAAVGRLAEAWPADADPIALAEVDRGWRRLGGLVDTALRRRAIAGRPAPADLDIALRRLTGVLNDRAEAAELVAFDRLEDLLLGPEPSRDPALVSIAVGFRQAVDRLDRLHERADWLAAAERIDPELRATAEAWIDERLVRLGAPALRVRAGRRLDELGALLARIDDPPGRQRMEDPRPGDRALVRERTREVVRAVDAARRERLRLVLTGEAAPAASGLERWLDVLAMIETVGAARERLARDGPAAARSHPDWFPARPAETIVHEAARAIGVAVDRALDDAVAGPPTDAVTVARARVALAAAWLAAARTGAAAAAAIAGRPDATGRAPSVPPSMLAAVRPSSGTALAEVSVHLLEAGAAARAGDDAAAEAHVELAAWLAARDFDPTRPGRTIPAGG